VGRAIAIVSFVAVNCPPLPFPRLVKFVLMRAFAFEAKLLNKRLSEAGHAR
jgi:hypothetical protein